MRRLVQAVAVLLVVIGLALGTYAALTPVTPVAPTAPPRAQETLAAQVPDAAPVVAQPGPQKATRVPPGRALVTLRIPRFGPTWEWTASEGIAQQVIDRGPGHYPGTALPGEEGNAAFAAHRAGHGDPFIDFDRLRPGDRVHIAQGRRSWTYVITMRPRIIEPTDVWVVDPLPGRMLTLTTCWPKYGSSHRMFVRAELTEETR